MYSAAIERGGHSALEKNGLFGAAGALEQREILHVARANLDDVGVFFDQIERFIVDRLRDDPEAVSGAHFRKNLEAVFPEPLKAVRGSAGFVSATAKKPRAGFLDAFGDGQALFLSLHGAGACHQGHVLASNNDVARRCGDAQNGVFFLGVAANQLVRLADRNAFHNAGKGFQNAKIDLALIAGDADGGSQRTGNRVSFEAKAFDALADRPHLLLGGMRLHDDQHA